MTTYFLAANFAFSLKNSSSNTSTAVIFSLFWFLEGELEEMKMGEEIG
jgi:hypothetical protein